MKPFEQQTYYELLEIPVTADAEEIRAAHERALEMYSPDSIAMYSLVDPDQVDVLRARLTEAMEILTEPDLRAEYDRMIGVTSAGPNTVVAPVPSLVEPEALPKALSVEATPETSPKREALEAEAEEEEEEEAPDVPVVTAMVAEPEPSSGAASFEIDLDIPPEAPAPSEPMVPRVAEVPAAAVTSGPAEAPRHEPAPSAPVLSVAVAAPLPEPVPAPSGGVAGAPPSAPELAVLPAVAVAQAPRLAAARLEQPLSMVPPPLPTKHRRDSGKMFAVSPSGQVNGTENEDARPPAGPGGRDLGEAHRLAQESAIATAEAALAQVAARAREPRPKPVDISPSAEFNGELLRQIRESRGLSLQQLAERTRISSRHLENVEADRYDSLPATVYLRGILMSVARELRLDPLRVSRSYLMLATSGKNN